MTISNTLADSVVLRMAGAALSSFRSSELASKNDALLIQSLNIVGKFQKKKECLCAFNPFIIAGFDPSENQWSDSIAKLLDPTCYHRLELVPLLALLDALLVETKRPEPCAQLCALRKTVEFSPVAEIRTRREAHRAGLGRPDIVIARDGPEGFLILIENKSRGGLETQNGEGIQSIRYERWIDEYCIDAGIPKDRAIGVYLTPENKTPSSQTLHSLSCSKLATSILLAIEARHSDDSGINAVEVFLRTYAWINGGQ